MPAPERSVFLDTAHVMALLNTADQRHADAVSWQQHLLHNPRPLLTTEFVLLEIADGLASIRFRNRASAVVRSIRADRKIHVEPATSELLEKGLRLYDSRPDKDWGLTDCTSFVVMTEHGLSDALTSDEHFRQAGFRVLLGMAPQTAG